MPSCGYACINCGRCKGRLPKPILVPLCPACGHDNPFGSETCEACGGSLELRPGITNLAGSHMPGQSNAWERPGASPNIVS